MVETMTDTQSTRLELLSRLDELDRLQTMTTDPDTLILIDARKAELRDRLDTH